jgi:hypothetical protein
MLEMAYSKYGLGEVMNPVLDTLEISRTMDRDYSKHSLSALVKRYAIPFDEEHHHRADYDAEGTGYIFCKMIKKMRELGLETLNDVKKLCSPEETHLFAREYHVNLLALNKTGLKNLFKIISLANTKYISRTPRIPRRIIEENREGLLIGSSCYKSEVFYFASTRTEKALQEVIKFYDYVEVQPPEVYAHLVWGHDISTNREVEQCINKIIECTKKAEKIIIATGDVHHISRDDKLYREIIVNQKVPGGGRHPLARTLDKFQKISSQHFRTTTEMLNDFGFLDEDLRKEIVIANPKKILDMAEEIEVIIDTDGVPFSPIIDKSVETTTSLVFDKAKEWYGSPLPLSIEERIAKELYGDVLYNSIKDELENEGGFSGKELEDAVFLKVHETILKGKDAVKDVIRTNIKRKDEDNLDDSAIEKKVNKSLGGIIGGGFDEGVGVMVLSTDTGYLKCVRPCKRRSVEGPKHRSIVTRLAWRNGESKRTERRARQFIDLEAMTISSGLHNLPKDDALKAKRKRRFSKSRAKAARRRATLML